MEVRNRGAYAIARREAVVEGSDVRAQVLTFNAGQFVPWHQHSEVADHFVCLKGPMLVETRNPDGKAELGPGDRTHVPPNVEHTVYSPSGDPFEFLIIQGVGTYDFIVPDD
jgi:quercetin dioxygenase-like cupin family protein